MKPQPPRLPSSQNRGRGARAQDVLTFWFGQRPYRAAQVAHHARLWFGDPQAPELTPQTDELIAERFGPLIRAAANGELSAWESSPRRRLALILLLDQFPRNVHRGTAAAFAQDSRALSLAISGMQFGADAALDPLERLFFYMPLMHAESMDVQEESVAAFRRLQDEAPPELRSQFDSALHYAQLHREVIARFGRFPHRNRILGRSDTPDEAAWLARDDAGF
ncbi:MAG TPA: DUF924 family protein [Steroidobacteraceae bacterium]|nr:DUF924 family protein [Steroidobacteraceae bacterium]